MATKAKTKNKKSTKTSTFRERYTQTHNEVLDFSIDTIESTVHNVERWQNLLVKSVKRTRPLIDKNFEIAFDTAETILEQYREGGRRFKSLFQNAPVKKPTNKKKTTTTIESKGPKVTKAKSAKKTSKNQKLTVISGIGPKIEGLLNQKGIHTLKDLAESKIATINVVLEEAGPRFNMHDPSTWIKQAKELVTQL